MDVVPSAIVIFRLLGLGDVRNLLEVFVVWSVALESRIQTFLNSSLEALNPRECKVSPESVNEHIP